MVSQNNGVRFLTVSFTPDPADFFLKDESDLTEQQYTDDYGDFDLKGFSWHAGL